MTNNVLSGTLSLYTSTTTTLQISYTSYLQWCLCGLCEQITVYIGKRDFVDYLSHIDPIGKWLVLQCY